MIRTLRDEGVDLTAGQSSGRKSLQYRESELGGAAAEAFMERQGEQFTRAALRRVGIDAPRATPEVIDDAFNRIGQQFDDLAARNRVVPDRQLVTDLRSTFNEYGQLVPQSARAPIVENVTNDIVQAIQQGGISGSAYQALRSRLDRAARSAARDPELSGALRGLRENIDDAMERSIAASNPADSGAWREARNQYRNMLVVERAATGAGENTALGLISPSQLRGATVQKQGRRAYARGQGDFAELARAGEALLKPLPNSGTAPRLAARGGSTAASATIGALLGGPSGAAIGAVAGPAIPWAVGRALLSGPGRQYLGNQALATGIQGDPRLQAIVSALLASQSLPKVNQ